MAASEVPSVIIYSSNRIRSTGNVAISPSNEEAVSRASKKSFSFTSPNYASISSFSSTTTTSGSEQDGMSIVNKPYASGLPYEVLEQCRKEFVKTANSEHIEYGYGSASEQLLERFFQQYKSRTGAIIQHIYVRESGNPTVLISLLKAVSNFEYFQVYPHAQMMALAALSNVSLEVREAGIRAYENWENPDGLIALKAAETPWDWLESYRLSTIEYLESFA